MTTSTTSNASPDLHALATFVARVTAGEMLPPAESDAFEEMFQLFRRTQGRIDYAVLGRLCERLGEERTAGQLGRDLASAFLSPRVDWELVGLLCERCLIDACRARVETDRVLRDFGAGSFGDRA